MANRRLPLRSWSEWQARTACNHATARSVEFYCHSAARTQSKIEHGKHVGRKLGLQL